jgi:ABC-type sugar transport system ATPase subunit
VVTTEPLGGETVVDLLVADRITKALVDPTLQVEDGQDVLVQLDPTRIHLFDADGDTLVSAAGADGVFDVRPAS